MASKDSDNKVHIRAIFLGILMMPIHSYWISKIEAIVYKGGGASTSSLIWTSVYNMMVLMVIFRLIGKLWPKINLSRADLLAIFAMCNIAACVAGHDMVQILVPQIAYPQWYAAPENEWEQTLLPYLPDAVTVKDKTTLSGYFVGDSSLYNSHIMRKWLTPFLIWSGFIFVLLAVALALNVIVQKKWTEIDRLSYPVIQLPLRLSAPTNTFFKNKLVWAGVGTAGVVLNINYLHRIFPVIPYIRTSYELGQYFTESPWNAVGWLPFNVIFNYIGLGFFVPMDILFSCWFFLLLFKAQIVFGRMVGFRSFPNFPYSYEQSSGGYLALGIIAIWITRKHLKGVFAMIFGKFKTEDSGEVNGYRIAIATIIIGIFLLIIFSNYLGMSIWVAASFFGMYYLILLAIARMRAEIGTPLHDLHFAGPSTILINMFGTRRMNQSTLVGMTQLWFIDRAYRSNPMPHQLEALKISERIGTKGNGFVYALIVASLLAGPMAIWALLNHSYEVGVQNAAPVNIYFGFEPWNRFQSWINNLTTTNTPSMIFTGFGFVTTILLMVGRMRFLWWPFHPVGYAISGSWQMVWGWGSFFIAWLIKLIILKYSGIKGFRKATGYFLGLLLGDVFFGGTWTMLGIAFDLW
ncbi:hypothetical protein GF312_05580 [Candidatus Poribacteria bacterium]|nr:hypothetical protein [Candidatus Poribacteria bacterium]